MIYKIDQSFFIKRIILILKPKKKFDKFNFKRCAKSKKYMKFFFPLFIFYFESPEYEMEKTDLSF